ncbi:hypothetical protein PAXINDRAFT_171771 [Paxillus involutus ATCC 200175]|uniref:MYND-type domain-containing protein n=1 Tax=Paxillus involutus ATCC 200175 TaxID=664439 RepID=A0A0C9T764_PAXIN|nr:hypothetical protein PAXINDRAFT_171771 [Paxillus involutus ATCC 200175]
MRESNFAFPAQNRACVCISSQLYDRRALDTTSPLPLFNSLHHLTYLTSTSPRIREIMTMDGGLERLVRMLHDFCMCPPPPENPNIIYGLSPSNSRPPKLVPTLNPPTFDKHAAYRFSLAFQCVVNIGVRGSESIRSRVVQAGTLDAVGCILEAWLANKGFAVGPNASPTGLPRESREQRLARRQALAEQRQRDGAAELTRALQRQITAEEIVQQERATGGADITVDEDVLMVDVSVDDTPSDISVMPDTSSRPVYIPLSRPGRPTYHRSLSSRETDPHTSTETSTNATPSSGTPTTGIVNGRERSGTIIARPVWGEPSGTNGTLRPRLPRTRIRMTASPDESTDNSRPETETEDDGDADVDMEQSHDTDDTTPSSHATLRAPRVPTRTMTQRPRRVVGIMADAPETAASEVNVDAHIIINHGQGGVVDSEGVGVVGVEAGIVSLEPNDDFAMGAPPGAPGAMDETVPARNMHGVDVPLLDRRTRTAPDATPRATVIALPPSGAVNAPGGATMRGGATGPARGDHASTLPGPTALGPSHVHHHRDTDSGPFKDEDVLLSLQLLAYLSKYPHVRQAFYKLRLSFHPAAANLPADPTAQQPVAGPSAVRSTVPASAQPTKETHGFFRAFTSSSARGKEKEKAPITSPSSTPTPPLRMTNVFSLVERFTFRPSSSDNDLPHPPPKLPPEIQYWAGVIMRNACRKDDNRGGIRQCANMLCGKWETYPREFAKCRRCRKAKYCGKECQSNAWSEGHRFWCSAKDGDEAEYPGHADHFHGGDGTGPDAGAAARAERRAERERLARERAGGGGLIPVNPVHLPPHSNAPLPPPVQPTRQRVSALPPTQPVPPLLPLPMPAFMRNRRRAETVSGAPSAAGLTSPGRPMYRHEIAWLADGRGRDAHEGAGGGAPGPAHPHAQLPNMMWEPPTQGDNDMVLG